MNLENAANWGDSDPNSLRRVRVTVPGLSLLLVLLACTAPAVNAQTVVTPAEVSVESITQQRAALESDTTLADDTRFRALELYDRALNTLEAARVMATRVAALEAVLNSAEERTVTLRGRLSVPAGAVAAAEVPSDASLERLQTIANERRTSLRIAREVLKEKESILDGRADQGLTYGDRIADLEQRLRRTLEELQTGSASQEDPELFQARHTFLLARQRSLGSEIALVRLQQGNHDTLVQLYTLERDVAAADLAELQPQIEALDALLQERRADEARAATAEAEATELAAAGFPASVIALAEENTELRTELEDLIGLQSEIEERQRTTEQTTASVESELARIKRRIDVVGPSEAVGRVLRRRLQQAPGLEDFLRSGSERNGEFHRAAGRRIDIEELQRELVDATQEIEAIMAAAAPELERFDDDQVRTQAEVLLTTRQRTLEDLQQQYRRYVESLSELDVAEMRLQVLVSEGVDFLRQELFWIKNLPSFSFADLGGLPRTVGWLFSAEGWKRGVEDGARKFVEHPATSLLALLAVLGLIYVRTQADRLLTDLAAKTVRISTDRFAHTLKAILYTVAAAVAWPMLAYIAGWHIRAEPFGAPFSVAAGQGMMYVAAYWFAFSFWRFVLRPEGLASRHFRWASPVTTDVEAGLRWLAWVSVPALFVIVATNLSGDVDRIKALGRPTFVLLLLAVTVFVWQRFGPTSVFAKHLRSEQNAGWLGRAQSLLFPALVILAITLAATSLLGHDYTALQLSRLLFFTICYLVGVWIFGVVLLRWFHVAERRLRLQEALRRREELRAHEQEEEKTDSDAIEIEIPSVNYRSLGRQGRAIVQLAMLVSGLLAVGLLWGDLLPAFGFLTEAELPFSRTTVVDGIERTVPVTAGIFVVGLLVMAGTFFAASNLSGLLELTVFSWSGLDYGKRYAIITLSRYVIITVGIVFALSMIGLQWSKLGWLVAAMGVGLGFGLQEIVANFVSGIILLVERPIRVGDLVTVGDTIGTVAKIEIRAATIITLDRKELLVPNKEFITGRVLNWTLSNEEHRLLINVGIAYGSDAGRAMELLMQAAAENDSVLEEPSPEVAFDGFGDNALNLSLRAFIPSADSRLRIKSELHQAIYKKLAEAGITIAFPQRDVHLDASKPLEIKLTPQGGQ